MTASQALLDEAVRQEADAIIVHHGYFWKNESPIIRGMKRNRLKTLLANDINLYGYHLPLDAHPELGNNVQLAQLLGITVMGEIEPLVPWGELSMPVRVWSWPRGSKHVSGVVRCGVATRGRIPLSALPGVPAAVRALSTAPRVLVLMRLLPVKSLSRRFTQPVNRGCIFTRQATMLPSVAVSAPSANG